MVYEANQNEGVVGVERKEGQMGRERDWPLYAGQIREKHRSRKGRVANYWSVPYCGHVRREASKHWTRLPRAARSLFASVIAIPHWPLGDFPLRQERCVDAHEERTASIHVNEMIQSCTQLVR